MAAIGGLTSPQLLFPLADIRVSSLGGGVVNTESSYSFECDWRCKVVSIRLIVDRILIFELRKRCKQIFEAVAKGVAGGSVGEAGDDDSVHEPPQQQALSSAH